MDNSSAPTIETTSMDAGSVSPTNKSQLNTKENERAVTPTSHPLEQSNEPITDPLSEEQNSVKRKEWVKFEDESPRKTPEPKESLPTAVVSPATSQPPQPAVLATETIHMDMDTNTIAKPNDKRKRIDASDMAVIELPNSDTQTTNAGSQTVTTRPPMRTIELSTGRIREGFANGDVIVTLLPVNTRWPWITRAIFRPELVPEELMAQGLTLTVEEYVGAMETLVNDYRFTLYNICYKRILMCWVILAFSVLLGLLFSGLNGIALFTLGIAWLFLNAAAIFTCMWMKIRLSRGLEQCLARVNKQLMKHKILLALDDRGKISCHKVNLCFIYFDPAQCIHYLNQFIERNAQNGTAIEPGWESRLDVDMSDIVIQGSNTTRVSRKQEMAALIFLRYSSRWANELVRGLIDVTPTEPGRHCASKLCPCQFIESHLSCKPRGVCCSCCVTMTDPMNQYYY